MYPLIILQHWYPEGFSLQDYVAKVTVLLIVSDFICEHLTPGPELYNSDSTESHLLLSPIASVRTIRISTYVGLTEFKVDSPGMGKTGSFLLHNKTRRNVTEPRVAASGICFKSMNSLGFLHS